MSSEMWRSLTDVGTNTTNTTYTMGQIVELYEGVPYLYAAVERRAKAMAALPFVWETPTGEDVENPSLPFDPMTLPPLFDTIEAHLTLYGRAYLFNRNARQWKIEALLPTTITEHYDTQLGLTHYTRTVNGTQQRIPLESLVRIVLPCRTNEVGWGKPPAYAAARAASNMNDAAALQAAAYAQGVISPTFITVDGAPPQDEIDKLQNWLTRRVQGVTNAFRAIAMRTGLTVHQLQTIDFNQLALTDLTDKQREDVLAAMGVPLSLVQSNAANYATAQQDWINLYDLTILPDARIIESALNTQMLRAQKVRIRFNEDELEVYRAAQAEAVKARVVDLVGRVITVDEAREELGYAAMTPEQREELLGAPVDPTPAPDIVAAQAAQDTQDTPPDETPDINSEDERAAIRQWRTMAQRRFRERNPEKARTFEHAAISGFAKSLILRGLESAETWEDATPVFALALDWAGYP